MKDTRLYIANQLVDLDAESIITLNYTLEETNNPTIVKNSFSKSISLPATERNNALFGHIYDLSRETILDSTKMSGVYFNTLKRTPFQLYIESELVESGYIHLSGIAKKNGVPRYSIQAYGGLGDFLYNLMYDENGDKRNLASLNFGFDGYSGDAEKEMNFRINKNIVNAAWQSLPRSERNSFAEAITFVPAYNGVGKDFDAQHALFSYQGVSAMGIPRSLSNSGTTFSSLNGYGCLEFNRSLDEAETKDLRSYLQRPALSVKSLFEACCKSENNGGYSVTLDPAFFKEENTLYHDAYITLPMMSTEVASEESVADVSSGDGYLGGGSYNAYRFIELGQYDISGAASNANIKVSVPISIVIDGADSDSLYLDMDVYPYKANYAWQYSHTYRTAIIAQLVAYKENGEILAASSEMVFSTQGKVSRNWVSYSPLDTIDRGMVIVKGFFEGKDGHLEFLSENKANTFPLELTTPRGSTKKIRLSLYVRRIREDVWSDLPEYDPSLLFKEPAAYGANGDYSAYYTKGNVVGFFADNGEVVSSMDGLPSISSESLVTKDILLGNTESPADYLLSYIKLFNLRIIKDVQNKSVTITPNYFVGEVVDIENRIDRGQEMSITPNLVTKKFVRMGLEQPDTYFASKYRNMHKLDYGQKRVDTGFAFNNDTEDIYDGNVYTSAVPCLATSRFFNTFYNKNGAEVFAPLADNPKLILANGTSEATGFSTYSEELVSASYVEPAKSIPFNVNKGYDLMPRMCYYDETTEGVRESVDIANNLVIYCGKRTLTNSNGGAVSYWLTDDVPEMLSLVGKNCYLLSNSTYPEGIECKALPLFLSVRLSSENIVLNSFDFAKGKEHYIPGIAYPDGATLYDKYWASLYADRLHVDSCKVSCFVNLSGLRINGDALRKFYYFDNSYWLLNKITDFDPTTDRLTKCEFIKVRDMSAYYIPTEGAETAVVEEDMDNI